MRSACDTLNKMGGLCSQANEKGKPLCKIIFLLLLQYVFFKFSLTFNFNCFLALLLLSQNWFFSFSYQHSVQGNLISNLWLLPLRDGVELASRLLYRQSQKVSWHRPVAYVARSSCGSSKVMCPMLIDFLYWQNERCNTNPAKWKVCIVYYLRL